MWASGVVGARIREAREGCEKAPGRLGGRRAKRSSLTRASGCFLTAGSRLNAVHWRSQAGAGGAPQHKLVAAALVGQPLLKAGRRGGEQEAHGGLAGAIQPGRAVGCACTHRLLLWKRKRTLARPHAFRPQDRELPNKLLQHHNQDTAPKQQQQREEQARASRFSPGVNSRSPGSS